jgi:photosystem II stability/assembly factor-like uncharacterized protein
MNAITQGSFAIAIVLGGCSSSSGGAAPSPDASSPADAPETTDAPALGDSGAPPTDGSSPGALDGANGASDAGPIQYAAACGDAGGLHSKPAGQWVSATSNLAGLGSECGNLSNLSSKPDEDMLIAGVAQQGLWASRNGGGTWTRLGAAMGSAAITNRTSEITYDPEHPQTFWESGIYNAGGGYKTTDDGTTLAALGSVTHNDSVSVDFTDPQRQTLLAGTHEQSGHLFLSTNGGAMWTDIGPKLPAGTGFSSQALVIDAKTYLLGAYTYSNSGGGLGVFRSIDSGQTWTQVFSTAVQGHPLVMSDGTIYWSVGGNGGIVKSTDQGKTWQQAVGQGVLVTGAPVALPDGRIAALSSQSVMVSSDCGASWFDVTTALPYAPTGVVYSPYQKAFFIWHFDCTGQSNPGDPVPQDAIMRFDFDYTSQ